ncbi:hypothetical protein MRX96_021122 [Rhipicephalus microplus]
MRREGSELAFTQSMCFSGLAPPARGDRLEPQKGSRASPMQAHEWRRIYIDRRTRDKQKSERKGEGGTSTPALQEGRAFLGFRPKRRAVRNKTLRMAWKIPRPVARKAPAGQTYRSEKHKKKRPSWTRRDSVRRERRQGIADPGLFQWRSSF